MGIKKISDTEKQALIDASVRKKPIRNIGSAAELQEAIVAPIINDDPKKQDIVRLLDRIIDEANKDLETIPLVCKATMEIKKTFEFIKQRFESGEEVDGFSPVWFNRLPEIGERFFAVSTTSDGCAIGFTAEVTEINEAGNIVFKMADLVLLYQAPLMLLYTLEPNADAETLLEKTDAGFTYKDSAPIDCFNRRPLVGETFYTTLKSKLNDVFTLTAEITGFTTNEAGREFAQFRTIEILLTHSRAELRIVPDETLVLPVSLEGFVQGYSNSIDAASLNRAPITGSLPEGVDPEGALPGQYIGGEYFWATAQLNDKSIVSFKARFYAPKTEEGNYPFVVDGDGSDYIVVLHNQGELQEMMAKKIAEAVASVVAGAPDSLDTLKELADWIAAHPESVAEINAAIAANSNNIANLNSLVSLLQSKDTALENSIKAVKGNIPLIANGQIWSGDALVTTGATLTISRSFLNRDPIVGEKFNIHVGENSTGNIYSVTGKILSYDSTATTQNVRYQVLWNHLVKDSTKINEIDKSLAEHETRIEEVEKQVSNFEISKFVTERPEVGEPNKIYFVAKTSEDSTDEFDEWIFVNKGTEEDPAWKWEYLGTKKFEIDPSLFVKHTDYATAEKAGVVIVQPGNGINVGGGKIYIVSANNTEIDAKKTAYKPITPANGDYFLRESITTNTEMLTDEEKSSACNFVGALKAITNTYGANIFRVYCVDNQGNQQILLTTDSTNVLSSQKYVDDGFVAKDTESSNGVYGKSGGREILYSVSQWGVGGGEDAIARRTNKGGLRVFLDETNDKPEEMATPRGYVDNLPDNLILTEEEKTEWAKFAGATRKYYHECRVTLDIYDPTDENKNETQTTIFYFQSSCPYPFGPASGRVFINLLWTHGEVSALIGQLVSTELWGDCIVVGVSDDLVTLYLMSTTLGCLLHADINNYSDVRCEDASTIEWTVNE